VPICQEFMTKCRYFPTKWHQNANGTWIDKKISDRPKGTAKKIKQINLK